MESLSPRQQIQSVANMSDHLLCAENLGVPGYALAQAERAGIVDRVVPGVYIGPHWPRHVLAEAASWALRHPDAVAGLLTAAVFHGLTDAFEQGTWLIVPLGSSPPRSRVTRVRVVQVAPWLVDRTQDVENGIETLLVHGSTMRVTGKDRTVIDLWRYPRLIEGEHALVSLRRRIGASDFQVPTFARLARRLEIWNRIEPVLQGMLTRRSEPTPGPAR